MKKLLYSLCAVAFVGVVAVILYNHFKLYHFKGFDLASIKTSLAMTLYQIRRHKCEI